MEDFERDMECFFIKSKHAVRGSFLGTWRKKLYVIPDFQVCFSQKSAFLLLSGFNTDLDTIFMEIQ